MLSSQISFGKKIRAGEFLIKNVRKNTPAKAAIYEFDCKDSSDIEELSKLSDDWQYKNAIIHKMRYTYEQLQFRKSCSSFYVAEDEKGDTIGILQTRDMKPDLVVDFIETKGEGKYKYIGQSMLSFLSKIALENDFKRIYVPIPVMKAWDFYTKKCKFRKVPYDCAVTLSKFGMKRLQRNTNKKIISKNNSVKI